MSIKVYEAYRVREGHDPFSVLWEIQRRGRDGIREKLLKIFKDVASGRAHEQHLKIRQQKELFTAWFKEKYAEVSDLGKIPVFSARGEWAREHCPPELKPTEGVYSVANDEIFEKGKRPKKIGTDETPGVFDIDSWARVQYGEQLTRYEKDLWALDTSVTAHVRDGRFYLIPYCERSSLVGGSLDFVGEMEELEDYSYWNNSDPPDETTEKEWEERADVWSYFTSRWTNYLTVEILSWGTWSEVSPMMHIAMTGEKLL